MWPPCILTPHLPGYKPKGSSIPLGPQMWVSALCLIIKYYTKLVGEPKYTSKTTVVLPLKSKCLNLNLSVERWSLMRDV